MAKYRIEQDGEDWIVVTTAADGIIDVISEHVLREEAEAARDEANRDTSGDERHHQAQYDYACGYYD